MPGYSGMGPRRLRPMIVGVPLEPGVGGMGGAYDIDAEGSVATFGITRESPLGGPRYTANPNTLWISRV